MQKLRVKSGPNFLHTAHQPCTLTRDAQSFFQLVRPSAVHLKGFTSLLDHVLTVVILLATRDEHFHISVGVHHKTTAL